MNNIIYLYFICALVAGLGPIFIKQFIITNKDYKYLALSSLMYIILIYTYYVLLQNNTLGITYNILKILSIILVTIISIIYYEEKLSKYQLIGFIFGLIAIYLLSVNKE